MTRRINICVVPRKESELTGEYLMKNNGVQFKGKMCLFVCLNLTVQHWNKLCTVSGDYITVSVQAKFSMSPESQNSCCIPVSITYFITLKDLLTCLLDEYL